jgi:hypothetical protein
MGRRACPACTHPKRRVIDRALGTGQAFYAPDGGLTLSRGRVDLSRLMGPKRGRGGGRKL